MAKTGPKPKDDSKRIPSKRLEYAREYRRRWYEKDKSNCPCSRPRVAVKDSVPICAVCLALETAKPKKHIRRNANADTSADFYNVHLPRLTSSPGW